MKFHLKSIAQFTLLLGMITIFSNCAKDEDDFLSESVDMLQVDRLNGYSRINYSFARTAINNLPYENLNIKEEKGIAFVRQQEKVAADFYTAMFQKWGNNVFANLATSESTHFRATDLFIDKYVMLDPCEGKEVGEFSSNSLQAFYSYLIKEGNKSVTDAYRASALMGESDIITLRNELTSITNNTDLRLFYYNLLTASRNHFRIAVKAYEKQGATYTPLVLDQEDYLYIINSGWEMEVED